MPVVSSVLSPEVPPSVPSPLLLVCCIDPPRDLSYPCALLRFILHILSFKQLLLPLLTYSSFLFCRHLRSCFDLASPLSAKERKQSSLCLPFPCLAYPHLAALRLTYVPSELHMYTLTTLYNHNLPASTFHMRTKYFISRATPSSLHNCYNLLNTRTDAPGNHRTRTHASTDLAHAGIGMARSCCTPIPVPAFRGHQYCNRSFKIDR